VGAGIRIPEGVTHVDFAGCAPPDPDDPEKRGSCANAADLGPRVDPAQSFTFGPGVAGAPPDVFYVSLQGNLGPDGLLCQNLEDPISLGVLQLTSLPESTTPVLTDEGIETVGLDLLQDPDSLAVPLENIRLVTQPADIAATLQVQPAPDDDGQGLRWEITLESQIDIHRITFGMVGFLDVLEAEMRFGGCTIPAGENNRRRCAANPDLGPSVNPDGALTFTMGPALGLASVRDDTLYVSLEGNKDRGFDPPSLNDPGSRILLGILEYLVPPSADPPQPGMTFEGATSLVSEITQEFDAGEPITAEQVLLVGEFDSQDDFDADGRGDDSDNCPFIDNPGQENRGGVNTTVPDLFGDVCQCGEATHDGAVFSGDDVRPLQEALVGLSGDSDVLARCSVSGGTECDILDIVLVGRVGIDADISQVCAPMVAP
jgi:hypothetical protein